jgi:formate/nitrite transporter FocA (FNT family)
MRVRASIVAVEKAITITQPVWAFVALGIQHEMRVRHIFICGLPRSTIFFHIISQTARFSKKKKLLDIKCVFRVSLQLLSETFLILRRIK